MTTVTIDLGAADEERNVSIVVMMDMPTTHERVDMFYDKQAMNRCTTWQLIDFDVAIEMVSNEGVESLLFTAFGPSKRGRVEKAVQNTSRRVDWLQPNHSSESTVLACFYVLTETRQGSQQLSIQLLYIIWIQCRTVGVGDSEAARLILVDGVEYLLGKPRRLHPCGLLILVEEH